MPSPVSKRESPLKDTIKRLLLANGFSPCWRAGAGPYSPSGVSDILACAPDGRFVAIEVKVGSNNLTKRQDEFLKMVAKNGGIAILAYNVADVQDALYNAGIVTTWPVFK